MSTGLSCSRGVRITPAGGRGRPRFAILGALLLSALAGASAVPAAAEPECGRIVAVGDLHGSYDAFVSILQETGVLDDALAWRDSTACLVQLGDVVDRGAASRRILDLLMRLEQDADGRLVLLLGNHEVMNLAGDLRSIHEGELAAFAADEDPADRRRGLRAFRKSSPSDDPALMRREFDWRYPPGWFAHRRAFAATGSYGRWLSGHAALAILDGTLFVHGGISIDDARRGIDAVNREVQAALATFAQQRGLLLGAGWLSEIDQLADVVDKLDERLSQGRPADAETRAARALLAAVNNTLMRQDGPLWNRDLALGEEAELDSAVDTILRVLGVRRIVVAHTPTEDHSIHGRFGGRVFTIDTGAAPIYGGRISALELLPDGTVQASYLDESRVLVATPPTSDAPSPSPAPVPGRDRTTR